METKSIEQRWNALPNGVKILGGNIWLDGENSLLWCKSYNDLSPLKQERAIKSIEIFERIYKSESYIDIDN